MANLSDGEDLDCPLCMEEIDLTDRYFKPCPCGYQICRFCWNHIKENLNGLCPACRRPYSEETVEFKPVSPEELTRIKLAKKKKERERKEQEMVARKQLANVRVVQKNLVYVLGLPPKVCSEEILKQNDYFGQYGKILKIVINRRPTTNAQGQTIINGGVYITYVKKDDAARAIEAVDGTTLEGRVIKATYGTTKYCSYYLRNQPCQNTLCQYLHEPGEEADTYVKEEKRAQTSTPKPAVFPSTPKKDDKEESALPPSANWAKPTRGSASGSPVMPDRSQTASPEYSGTSIEASLVNKLTKFDDDGEVPDDSMSNTNFTVPENIQVDELNLFALGFNLFPKYNGPFNPFADTEALNERFAVNDRNGLLDGPTTGERIMDPSNDLRGNVQDSLRALLLNQSVSSTAPNTGSDITASMYPGANAYGNSTAVQSGLGTRMDAFGGFGFGAGANTPYMAGADQSSSLMGNRLGNGYGAGQSASDELMGALLGRPVQSGTEAEAMLKIRSMQPSPGGRQMYPSNESHGFEFGDSTWTGSKTDATWNNANWSTDNVWIRSESSSGKGIVGERTIVPSTENGSNASNKPAAIILVQSSQAPSVKVVKKEKKNVVSQDHLKSSNAIETHNKETIKKSPSLPSQQHSITNTATSSPMTPKKQENKIIPAKSIKITLSSPSTPKKNQEISKQNKAKSFDPASNLLNVENIESTKNMNIPTNTVRHTIKIQEGSDQDLGIKNSSEGFHCDDNLSLDNDHDVSQSVIDTSATPSGKKHTKKKKNKSKKKPEGEESATDLQISNREETETEAIVSKIRSKKKKNFESKLKIKTPSKKTSVTPTIPSPASGLTTNPVSAVSITVNDQDHLNEITSSPLKVNSTSFKYIPPESTGNEVIEYADYEDIEVINRSSANNDPNEKDMYEVIRSKAFEHLWEAFCEKCAEAPGLSPEMSDMIKDAMQMYRSKFLDQMSNKDSEYGPLHDVLQEVSEDFKKMVHSQMMREISPGHASDDRKIDFVHEDDDQNLRDGYEDDECLETEEEDEGNLQDSNFIIQSKFSSRLSSYGGNSLPVSHPGSPPPAIDNCFDSQEQQLPHSPSTTFEQFRKDLMSIFGEEEDNDENGDHDYSHRFLGHHSRNETVSAHSNTTNSPNHEISRIDEIVGLEECGDVYVHALLESVKQMASQMNHESDEEVVDEPVFRDFVKVDNKLISQDQVIPSKKISKLLDQDLKHAELSFEDLQLLLDHLESFDLPEVVAGEKTLETTVSVLASAMGPIEERLGLDTLSLLNEFVANMSSNEKEWMNSRVHSQDKKSLRELLMMEEESILGGRADRSPQMKDKNQHPASTNAELNPSTGKEPESEFDCIEDKIADLENKLQESKTKEQMFETQFKIVFERNSVWMDEIRKMLGLLV